MRKGKEKRCFGEDFEIECNSKFGRNAYSLEKNILGIWQEEFDGISEFEMTDNWLIRQMLLRIVLYCMYVCGLLNIRKRDAPELASKQFNALLVAYTHAGASFGRDARTSVNLRKSIADRALFCSISRYI